jgi:hypothetical protein
MQRATIDIDASLIDQLMVICLYRDWKDASAEVSAAYSRSSDAGPTDRTLAFAAYGAALDREEAAARAYATRLAGLTRAVSAERSHSAGSRAVAPMPVKPRAG